MPFRRTQRPRDDRDDHDEIMEAIGELRDGLARVFTLLSTITLTEFKIAMNIQDIQAKADDTLKKVEADADVSNAVKTVVYHQNDVLAALQQQIKDLSASNDPAALQKLSDTIDKIKASETSNAQVVADAVTAGTAPATPPADPAPATPPADQPAAQPINQPEPPPQG